MATPRVNGPLVSFQSFSRNLVLLAFAYVGVGMASDTPLKLCDLLINKVGGRSFFVEASSLPPRERISSSDGKSFQITHQFGAVNIWNHRNLVVALSHNAGQLLFFDFKSGELKKNIDIKLARESFFWRDKGIDFGSVMFKSSKNGEHLYVLTREGKLFHSSLENLYQDRSMLCVI